MGVPLTAKIALWLNIIFEGGLAVAMVAGVVGPDELRPVGEAEVVAVPGLFFAAITMLAVGCLGAIAAIATGAKSPTVAVPPLLTGVAYHGLIALPLYRRGLAIGSQGPELWGASAMHVVLAVISLAGVLHCHWVRQGGVVPKGKRS